MPVATPVLDLAAAVERSRACFVPDEGNQLGIEVEWLVMDPDDLLRPVSADETRAAADIGALVDDGRITIEPGGQLELSAACHADLGIALDALDREEAQLRDRCHAAGLVLVDVGLEPVRTLPRTLDAPRYQAMEQVFAAAGSAGMTMATATASVQVNVDVGDDPVAAWRLAGMLGPVLLATFANSPFRAGRATGWKSTRQLLWSAVPGGRGAPVPTWSLDAWVERVLDTDVLYVQTDADTALAGAVGFTFRRWLAEGHPAGFPDAEDLDRHLTTLFPPVRPRGWLELRMLDAMPRAARRVAVAMAFTLLTDPAVRGAAAGACLPVAGTWGVAARDALADPALARAAGRCLHLTADALDSDPTTRGLADECRAWAEGPVAAGRCPADDLLDAGDPLAVTRSLAVVGP